MVQSSLYTGDGSQSRFTKRQQKIERLNVHRRLRISIAVLTAVICSFTIHTITTQNLRHSRNLHRSLNSYILQHTDLSIYWFGYRTGQYLINYPIHQYYELDEFSQFLQRMQQIMANFNSYAFGAVDQQQMNTTKQKIIAQYDNGSYVSYYWKIEQGLVQPFTSNDTQTMKEILIQCKTLQIQVVDVTIKNDNKTNSFASKWDLFFIVQPYSKTSIFVTLFMQEHMNLGYQHIPHFLLGVATLMLILYELRQRQHRRRLKATNRNDYLTFYTYRYILYKFKPSDAPDFLVAFFLLYSSFACFTNIYTLHYLLVLDGVTCFISWLYFLKFQTESDDYHISMLIKKSYILVGRLFVSFGPMFIGFVLFALTAFCRYTSLFEDFHKSFISLFCVCYYNMTYQQYRTTERANPISTIFFTSLIMIFTICTYSGMLVSVFCSYMWNKRQQKNKEELMQSLKIQCTNCNTKYNYAQGYKSSVKKSIHKKELHLLDQEDTPEAHAQYRRAMRQKKNYLEHKFEELLNSNEEIVQGFIKEGMGGEIQNQYCQDLMKFLQRIEKINASL